jgi:metal-responsive CopG/Arc/MetJ family transcriptional regulator
MSLPKTHDRINLTLPKELLLELRRLSQETDRSVSYIVSKAVKTYLTITQDLK